MTRMLKFIKPHSKIVSPERLQKQKELFTFTESCFHGFPAKPTALAWDQKLQLVAIATKNGHVRVFGDIGIEFYGHQDEAESPIIKLCFIDGEGLLVSLCENNSLCLWRIEQELESTPSLVRIKTTSLEGKLKRISTMVEDTTGKRMYIGTEGGNVYILDVESFSITNDIIYQDVVVQNIPEDYKVNPGPIETITTHPNDPEKILIGYQRGLIVLWDCAKMIADQSFVSSQQLEYLCWNFDASEFISSHNDGSFVVWSIEDSTKPKEGPTTVYGPYPCKPITKIIWKKNLDGYLTIFSGGMQRANFGDRFTVTLMQDDKHVTFNMTSRVVDFVVTETDEKGYANCLIILAEEEIVFVDLQTEGWPSFQNAYLSSLHASAVTCSQFVAKVDTEVFNKIKNAGKNTLSGYSSREWPIKGGKTPDSNDSRSTYDILLTGHEDGVVRFWDASDVCLQLIYKLSTEPIFISENLGGGHEDEDEDWPPFRKIGSFDPYSDDPRLGIKKLEMCPHTGILVVAGTAGQIVVYDVGQDPKEINVTCVDVNLVAETDNFVWKSHSKLDKNEEIINFAVGMQPLVMVQFYPPASFTSLTLHSEWGLMAAGTAHGFALFDYIVKKNLLAKSTLSPLDFANAADEGPMSRRKSLKKSLRESFRRLRKGRSQKKSSLKKVTPVSISHSKGLNEDTNKVEGLEASFNKDNIKTSEKGVSFLDKVEVKPESRGSLTEIESIEMGSVDSGDFHDTSDRNIEKELKERVEVLCKNVASGSPLTNTVDDESHEETTSNKQVSGKRKIPFFYYVTPKLSTKEKVDEEENEIIDEVPFLYYVTPRKLRKTRKQNSKDDTSAIDDTTYDSVRDYTTIELEEKKSFLKYISPKSLKEKRARKKKKWKFKRSSAKSKGKSESDGDSGSEYFTPENEDDIGDNDPDTMKDASEIEQSEVVDNLADRISMEENVEALPVDSEKSLLTKGEWNDDEERQNELVLDENPVKVLDDSNVDEFSLVSKAVFSESSEKSSKTEKSFKNKEEKTKQGMFSKLKFIGKNKEKEIEGMPKINIEVKSIKDEIEEYIESLDGEDKAKSAEIFTGKFDEKEVAMRDVDASEVQDKEVKEVTIKNFSEADVSEIKKKEQKDVSDGELPSEISESVDKSKKSKFVLFGRKYKSEDKKSDTKITKTGIVSKFKFRSKSKDDKMGKEAVISESESESKYSEPEDESKSKELENNLMNTAEEELLSKSREKVDAVVEHDVQKDVSKNFNEVVEHVKRIVATDDVALDLGLEDKSKDLGKEVEEVIIMKSDRETEDFKIKMSKLFGKKLKIIDKVSEGKSSKTKKGRNKIEEFDKKTLENITPEKVLEAKDKPIVVEIGNEPKKEQDAYIESIKDSSDYEFTSTDEDTSKKSTKAKKSNKILLFKMKKSRGKKSLQLSEKDDKETLEKSLEDIKTDVDHKKNGANVSETEVDTKVAEKSESEAETEKRPYESISGKEIDEEVQTTDKREKIKLPIFKPVSETEYISDDEATKVAKKSHKVGKFSIFKIRKDKKKNNEEIEKHSLKADEKLGDDIEDGDVTVEKVTEVVQVDTDAQKVESEGQVYPITDAAETSADEDSNKKKKESIIKKMPKFNFKIGTKKKVVKIEVDETPEKIDIVEEGTLEIEQVGVAESSIEKVAQITESEAEPTNTDAENKKDKKYKTSIFTIKKKKKEENMYELSKLEESKDIAETLIEESAIKDKADATEKDFGNDEAICSEQDKEQNKKILKQEFQEQTEALKQEIQDQTETLKQEIQEQTETLKQEIQKQAEHLKQEIQCSLTDTETSADEDIVNKVKKSKIEKISIFKIKKIKKKKIQEKKDVELKENFEKEDIKETEESDLIEKAKKVETSPTKKKAGEETVAREESKDSIEIINIDNAIEPKHEDQVSEVFKKKWDQKLKLPRFGRKSRSVDSVKDDKTLEYSKPKTKKKIENKTKKTANAEEIFKEAKTLEIEIYSEKIEEKPVELGQKVLDSIVEDQKLESLETQSESETETERVEKETEVELSAVEGEKLSSQKETTSEKFEKDEPDLSEKDHEKRKYKFLHFGKKSQSVDVKTTVNLKEDKKQSKMTKLTFLSKKKDKMPEDIEKKSEQIEGKEVFTDIKTEDEDDKQLKSEDPAKLDLEQIISMEDLPDEKVETPVKQILENIDILEEKLEQVTSDGEYYAPDVKSKPKKGKKFKLEFKFGKKSVSGDSASEKEEKYEEKKPRFKIKTKKRSDKSLLTKQVESDEENLETDKIVDLKTEKSDKNLEEINVEKEYDSPVKKDTVVIERKAKEGKDAEVSSELAEIVVSENKERENDVDKLIDGIEIKDDEEKIDTEVVSYDSAAELEKSVKDSSETSKAKNFKSFLPNMKSTTNDKSKDNKMIKSTKILKLKLFGKSKNDEDDSKAPTKSKEEKSTKDDSGISFGEENKDSTPEEDNKQSSSLQEAVEESSVPKEDVDAEKQETISHKRESLTKENISTSPAKLSESSQSSMKETESMTSPEKEIFKRSKDEIPSFHSSVEGIPHPKIRRFIFKKRKQESFHLKRPKTVDESKLRKFLKFESLRRSTSYELAVKSETIDLDKKEKGGVQTSIFGIFFKRKASDRSKKGATDDLNALDLACRHPSIDTFIDATPVCATPINYSASESGLSTVKKHAQFAPDQQPENTSSPYLPNLKITMDRTESLEPYLSETRTVDTCTSSHSTTASTPPDSCIKINRKLKMPCSTQDDELVKPVERAIEARTQAPDYIGSMVRCLHISKCYIASNQLMSATLWAGTNSGAVYIFTIAVPPSDKRLEVPLSVQLGKEIHLKHAAPVTNVTILDAASKPFPEAMAVKRGAAPSPDNNGPHRVLITSEEQFKVFTLPQLKPYCKFKVTAQEGSRVRKTGVADFVSKVDKNYKETCVMSVTNSGDISVYSLPDTKKQVMANCIKREDISGINSVVFTREGEALYLVSASEMARISLSTRHVTSPRGIIPQLLSKNKEKEKEALKSAVEIIPEVQQQTAVEQTNAQQAAPEVRDPKLVNKAVVRTSMEAKEGSDSSFLSGDITIDSIRDHMDELKVSDRLESSATVSLPDGNKTTTVSSIKEESSKTTGNTTVTKTSNVTILSSQETTTSVQVVETNAIDEIPSIVNGTAE